MSPTMTAAATEPKADEKQGLAAGQQTRGDVASANKDEKKKKGAKGKSVDNNSTITSSNSTKEERGRGDSAKPAGDPSSETNEQKASSDPKKRQTSSSTDGNVINSRFSIFSRASLARGSLFKGEGKSDDANNSQIVQKTNSSKYVKAVGEAARRTSVHMQHFAKTSAPVAAKAYKRTTVLLKANVWDPSAAAVREASVRAGPTFNRLRRQSEVAALQFKTSAVRRFEKVKESDQMKLARRRIRHASVMAGKQAKVVVKKAKKVRKDVKSRLHILHNQVDQQFAERMATVSLKNEFDVGMSYLKCVEIRRREVSALSSGPSEVIVSNSEMPSLMITDEGTFKKLLNYKWSLVDVNLVTRLKSDYQYDIFFHCNTHYKISKDFDHAVRIGKDYTRWFRLGKMFLVPCITESLNYEKWLCRINDPDLDLDRSSFYEFIDHIYKSFLDDHSKFRRDGKVSLLPVAAAKLLRAAESKPIDEIEEEEEEGGVKAVKQTQGREGSVGKEKEDNSTTSSSVEQRKEEAVKLENKEESSEPLGKKQQSFSEKGGQQDEDSGTTAVVPSSGHHEVTIMEVVEKPIDVVNGINSPTLASREKTAEVQKLPEILTAEDSSQHALDVKADDKPSAQPENSASPLMLTSSEAIVADRLSQKAEEKAAVADNGDTLKTIAMQ